MKIRTGFVSNSSASSFCIYGAILDGEDFFTFKGLSKVKKNNPERYKKFLDCVEKDNVEYSGDVDVDILKNLSKKDEDKIEEILDEIKYSLDMEEVYEFLFGVERHTYGDSDDVVYVGRSWSKIGGEETGNQFKASVEKALKDLVGKKVKCETHEEAWM